MYVNVSGLVLKDSCCEVTKMMPINQLFIQTLLQHLFCRKCKKMIKLFSKIWSCFIELCFYAFIWKVFHVFEQMVLIPIYWDLIKASYMVQESKSFVQCSTTVSVHVNFVTCSFARKSRFLNICSNKNDLFDLNLIL